jgi:hypothetical protein
VIEAIASVLPLKQRTALNEPPPVPEAQFQIIEQVSDLGVASQRALTILSQMGKAEAAPKANTKQSTRTEDDYPEVDVSRGTAISVSA